MDVIQSFRLSGTTDVEEIACDQVDGENVIYWEDIKDAFPGVHTVKHGKRTVKKLRDSKGNRIEPECIRHHPDVVLEVVSHPAFKNGAVEFPMPFSAPSLNNSKDYPPKASVILGAEDNIDGPQLAHLPQDISNNDNSRRPLLYTPAPLPQSSSSGIRTGSKLSFRQVVKLAQKKAIEFEVEQRLVTSLPSEVQRSANRVSARPQEGGGQKQ
ncbi:hypothetical protein BGX34_002479 [Mortierella sp. NVP85]|nr:hypothetical protein BGX34_002479 [Mortierella sp. NVP85]